jgi:hypothetical protein
MCPLDSNMVQLRTWQVHGGVLAALGLFTENAGCTLKTTLRVTVRDRKGVAVGGIRGNPAVWRTAQQLTPWSNVVHTWLWRNWCRSAQGLVIAAGAHSSTIASIRVTTPTHHARRRRHPPLTPPRCENPRTSSRLVDLGLGRRPIPLEIKGIPARILPADTPLPLSPSLIRVTNAWLVSDGRTLVAVYAGEAGDDPSVGLFAVVRQDLDFGLQVAHTVTVGPTGAVSVTQAPAGAAVETSAQREDIGFTSTSGAHGVLHLADDTITLAQ